MWVHSVLNIRQWRRETPRTAGQQRRNSSTTTALIAQIRQQHYDSASAFIIALLVLGVLLHKDIGRASTDYLWTVWVVLMLSFLGLALCSALLPQEIYGRNRSSIIAGVLVTWPLCFAIESVVPPATPCRLLLLAFQTLACQALLFTLHFKLELRYHVMYVLPHQAFTDAAFLVAGGVCDQVYSPRIGDGTDECAPIARYLNKLTRWLAPAHHAAGSDPAGELRTWSMCMLRNHQEWPLLLRLLVPQGPLLALGRLRICHVIVLLWGPFINVVCFLLVVHRELKLGGSDVREQLSAKDAVEVYIRKRGLKAVWQFALVLLVTHLVFNSIAVLSG